MNQRTNIRHYTKPAGFWGKLLTLSLLALALQAIPVEAATTYYVSTTGNDANAGTQASPWRTIQKAANTLNAGDTAIIQPGTYSEAVSVSHSGTSGNPITFQAATWHGVVMNHSTAYTLFQPASSSIKYITVRGLVFSQTPFRPYNGNNDWPNSVYVFDNWRLEDCVVEKNMGLGLRNFGTDVADNVVISNTVFQDCYINGAGGAGNGDGVNPRMMNTLLQNVLFRRNNQKNVDPSWLDGANKFLWHDGFVIDGYISYDNNGSGLWHDYGSVNWVLRDATIFGNHAGRGLELNGTPDTDTRSWAGPGFWSEANPGPGRVENCVFYSNLAAGFGDLDSASVTVTNCFFIDNGIEFRALTGGYRNLQNATVKGNSFKFSKGSAWYTSVGSFTSTQPSGMGVILDQNKYEAFGGYGGAWASWNGTSANGIAQLRSSLGTEASGSQQTLNFRGTLFNVVTYPVTTTEASSPDPAKMKQVTADETSSIDSAIGSSGVNAVVTIPVFGHGRFVGSGPYTCVVYDLTGRWITLDLPDAAATASLDAAVPGYTVTTKANISVKLTATGPYNIRATYPATGGGSAPLPPTNLAAAPGDTQVSLTWTASSGATSYNVKRSTTSSGPYTTVASGIATASYNDTSLSNGTTYYYVVTAVNATGESGNSNQASATPSAPLPGSPVYQVNVGGTAASPYAADSNFTAGTAYEESDTINTSGVSNPAPMAVYQSYRYVHGSGGTFSYAFPSLTVGAAYTVRLHFADFYNTASGQRKFHVDINGTRVLTDFDIIATAGAANKATIQSFTATADSTGKITVLFTATALDSACVNGIEILTSGGSPPSAPTGLTATAGNAQVTLAWSASSGASSYNVKRSTTSGGPYSTIVTGVTSLSYTNTALSNGTTYYYVVSAVNANGESANSVQASATPLAPPAAPTGLTATAGDSQVTLGWTASSGATSYNVKRSTTSGGSYTTIASGVTTTSYNNTGLSNGTTYYFVVSAVNAIGESGNSSQVAGTPAATNPGTPVYQVNAGSTAVSPYAADAYYTNGTPVW